MPKRDKLEVSRIFRNMYKHTQYINNKQIYIFTFYIFIFTTVTFEDVHIFNDFPALEITIYHSTSHYTTSQKTGKMKNSGVFLREAFYLQ